MRLILIITSLITILSSCSFEEEYTFNSDWSGTYESVLDVSGLVEFGGDEGDKEFIEDSEKAELIKSMNEVKGISEAEVIYDDEENYLKFKFKFDDLESVNRLQKSDFGKEEGDSPLEALGSWEMSHKGKKKFYMDMPIVAESSSVSGESESEVGKMGEMLSVTTVLTFPKEIKSLTSEVAKMGDTPNSVIITYTGKDIVTKSKNWRVEVKL